MDINERVSKIKMLLEKYPDYLSDFEINFLLNYAKREVPPEKLVPDIVREVYDELGLLSKENNIYEGFIELVDSVFPLENRKILEIGGGVFPRLGLRIEKLLSPKGRITVYDPRLARHILDTPKITLVREKANRCTDIKDTNLIIGLMPCEAAEVIIDLATSNRVNFMVSLCEGGPHGEEFDYFEDDDHWRDYILRKADNLIEKNGLGKLKIKSLEKYGSPYPVIYNERDK